MTAWERPWLANYSHEAAWDTRFEAMPVHHILERSASVTPNAPYLEFLGRSYTYGEVMDLVCRATKGFQKLGVQKGVKVGLFLPNCPQYVIAYYAILKAGGTVVNFSPLYSVDELAAQVEDSETDIMVCLDVASLYATISQVLERSRLKCLVVGSLARALPPVKSVLYRLFRRREQAEVTIDERHVAFEALVSNDGRPAPVQINPEEDLALLQYTGGTTGRPKGAMLTHANLSINAQQVAAVDNEAYTQPQRMLGALPFFHVFANTVVLNMTTLVGGEVIMLPKFELGQAIKTIRRTKVTVLPGVPTMYTAMLNHAARQEQDLASLRLCISGGAPLPVELKAQFGTATPAVLVEGYGLTESSGVVSVNPFHGVNKPGSIGLPLPGTDIVIVDKDDPTRVLPVGEAGELTIGGPQIMRGYWRRDNKDVFVDGRLRTGDVGYIDPDGYTFIIDRMKDMITVGGFKVYPRMLEELLYQHPAVQEATVIGIPDDYLGQRPKAFVVLKPDHAHEVDGAALLAWLNGKVAKHERVAAIEIRDSLPKTMIGKLSKKELVEEEMARRVSAVAVAAHKG
ncbi:long-chain-fatty-acid--CoA ligase [Pedomonas mirosovicensis]|uniref:long-chain-fatty-acid--CoA ligase n=1 Tax=Pedomonas mirosovicensis TaxID=2908641 RepID=UPI002167CFD3|nr:long-chain fatty acid--CoA ligase [Pedomonas mirosovicensis]MCH8684923.1 long-chain fatty acid--CoA ligase [Pedomonas mirosovicensis]